jgi:hypothetical protein
MTGMHEDFSRRHEVASSSHRSFGCVIAACFVLLAFGPIVRGHAARPWPLAPAAVFALVALARPAVLRPLNRIWTQLGLLLNRVTSPVILGLIFFLVVTPLGWLMRRIGKDSLKLRSDPAARSYWIPRTPAGRSPASMTRQF